jgi:hypothetical protein
VFPRSACIVLLGCASGACALTTDLEPLRGPDAGEAGTDAGADASEGSADVVTTDAPDSGTLLFFDDFNRADSTQIGNSWLTKMTAFQIANDMLDRYDPNPSIGYRDNVVYRPSSEDVLDVQVSVEVRYTSFANAPYPQIHVRMDPNTVYVADQLDDYLFYPTTGQTTSMSIARQHGMASEVALASFAVNPPLDTTHTFRFTLGVTGTTSVALSGTVEMLSGNAWTMVGEGTVTDTDANRIASPGSVGLSASNGEATGDYTYDNFTVTAL